MEVEKSKVINGGVNRVLRTGNVVTRPLGKQTPAVHALLSHLEIAGFVGAPRVISVDDESGEETLTVVSGEVTGYPYALMVNGLALQLHRKSTEIPIAA